MWTMLRRELLTQIKRTISHMVKISIGADRFPEKQQHLRCRDLDCEKKQRSYCAHATRQHRRNEWA